MRKHEGMCFCCKPWGGYFAGQAQVAIIGILQACIGCLAFKPFFGFNACKLFKGFLRVASLFRCMGCLL
jgi:hypothetical protein